MVLTPLTEIDLVESNLLAFDYQTKEFSEKKYSYVAGEFKGVNFEFFLSLLFLFFQKRDGWYQFLHLLVHPQDSLQ